MIAHQLKQDDRARTYLQNLLVNYPRSPMVPDVKRELAKLAPRGKSSGSGT